MLDFIRLIVQDILLESCDFLYLISTGRCFLEGDFTVLVGRVIAEELTITPDFELHACKRLLGLAVDLDDLKLLLERVINYELCVAVCGMFEGDRLGVEHITG